MTDIQKAEPETAGLSSMRLERVGDWMRRYVDEGKLPWAMTAIIREGALVYREAAGLADVEAGRAIFPDAICRIYSMSKPVTAVAALKLYEQGLFGLEDPVEAYIPQLADMSVRVGETPYGMHLEPARRPMTIRDLFCHTSGFTYSFNGTDGVAGLYRENRVDFGPRAGTLGEVVTRLGDLPLDHHPGARWTYGVSIDVLGYLVEVLSGKPFDRYLAEEIFEPLGMTDTFFELPKDRVERFVPCYERTPDNRFRRVDGTADSRFASAVTCCSGGGGLLSTMNDYLRFADMLREGGRGILGRRTVEFMATNHLPDDSDLAAMGQEVFAETSYIGVGFGLGVSVMLDPAAAGVMASPGEFAWGGMASTAFWVDPLEDMAVVFMTQLIPSGSYPIRKQLRVLVNQALTA
ncbi:MAG: beta-lactamase family protein [Alphaproteobacteria bacterium]|nr:beta-lactamase family protein [Alphaproteobacteria bacterium]